MNLVLCGLSRCGKTTVGKKLAEKIGWAFLDTDECAGSRELYLQKGDSFFRSLEKEAVSSLVNCSKTVIATGGGTLLDPDNREIVKTLGLCIYLKIETHVARERGMSPHLATDEAINKRIPTYEEAANLTINTHQLTVDQIINEIIWAATPLGIFSK